MKSAPLRRIRKPQAEALSNKTRKGEGFQRENRRDPTLPFPLVSKGKIDIARNRRSGSRVDSWRISHAPTMKTRGSSFGNVGGPIPPQVTLRSFSAPPVPGELRNDLRVTWGGMGPPHWRQDPPGPDSKRNRECYFPEDVLRHKAARSRRLPILAEPLQLTR